MVVLGLAVAAFVTACGGDGNGEPAAENQTVALTLTGESCTYAGPESTAAGSMLIDVENQSGVPAAFEVVLVGEGSSSVVQREEVVARWSSSLSVDLEPGTYEFRCSTGPPSQGTHVAATLEVTAG
jgi:hypothetical protein